MALAVLTAGCEGATTRATPDETITTYIDTYGVAGTTPTTPPPPGVCDELDPGECDLAVARLGLIEPTSCSPAQDTSALVTIRCLPTSRKILDPSSAEILLSRFSDNEGLRRRATAISVSAGMPVTTSNTDLTHPPAATAWHSPGESHPRGMVYTLTSTSMRAEPGPSALLLWTDETDHVLCVLYSNSEPAADLVAWWQAR